MTYFVDGEFCLLAHRGLSQHKSNLDENTLDAFEEALNHGATHVESDIQATSDGFAVLFHDHDLNRVARVDKKISELTLEQISQLRLNHGGKIPTLEQALRKFPNARFNLDLKAFAAIEPTAKVLSDLGAHGRVLLSSFNAKTRQEILNKTNRQTASSADARTFLSMYAAHKVASPLIRAIRRDFHALQIPVSRSFLKFDSPRFTEAVRKLGLQLHYWTVNDPAEMLRLSKFATGIVTDRVDLAPNSLRT